MADELAGMTLSKPSNEKLRLDDLVNLLPRGRATILEIGSRHGAVTKQLVEHFESVTALDLEKPSFQIDRVIPVKGDVQSLQFPDRSFDCVLCTEVLEHVPDLDSAAREIARVARHEVLIGVPYRQDTRVGRTTCAQCGRINPPYGHINQLDENTLQRLFSGLEVSTMHKVARSVERTNSLSTWLQDFGLNPYGTYEQEEPCIYCSQKLTRPGPRPFVRRLSGAAGLRIQRIQQVFNRPMPTWIHVLFRRT